MKLDSKLFDPIRIRPRRAEMPHVEAPRCDWEGCSEPGLYRAPKGNRAEGQYHHFCLEHVRHYNTAFNFFEGMKADDIAEHVNRSAQTEGRPTWNMGSNPTAGAARAQPRPHARGSRFHDPLHVFARFQRAQARSPSEPKGRALLEPDRRAFEALGLEGRAPADEIKRAYKSLVKIHHPDANGGDRSSEDRLRAIIMAYTHLKNAGFVGR